MARIWEELGCSGSFGVILAGWIVDDHSILEESFETCLKLFRWEQNKPESRANFPHSWDRQ